MAVFDQDAAVAALDRLLAVAQSDTGPSPRVANVRLAGWTAVDGVDLRDLWMSDRASADDSLAVARLISIRHEYPSADGYGPQFEQLVADWRLDLLAGRAWMRAAPCPVMSLP